VTELTELVLVRHGESVGNVARERALAAGLEMIEVDRRDADVPLTETGVHQAEAVGRWLAQEAGAVPDVVYSSPYLRARQTAQVALATAGLDRQVHLDERLRDRELGVLDLLTSTGVQQRFPDEAVRRRWLGKLYYRPPGGESWSDVALRLRSFISDLTVAAPEARRALLASHDAVIMLLRYVCEGWDEETLLETAARTEVANASVTRLVRDPDGSPLWVAESFNAVEHLTAPPGSTAAVESSGQEVGARVDRA
jgi:broad specificity phosphatase PhoE